jgi:hypothetical protein
MALIIATITESCGWHSRMATKAAAKPVIQQISDSNDRV